MSLTKAQADHLRAVVRRYVKAAIADSWAGSRPAEEIPVIEREHSIAKRRFLTLVRELHDRPNANGKLCHGGQSDYCLEPRTRCDECAFKGRRKPLNPSF